MVGLTINITLSLPAGLPYFPKKRREQRRNAPPRTAVLDRMGAQKVGQKVRQPATSAALYYGMFSSNNGEIALKPRLVNRVMAIFWGRLRTSVTHRVRPDVDISHCNKSLGFAHLLSSFGFWTERKLQR